MVKDQCVCPQCLQALKAHRDKSDRDFCVGLIVLIALMAALLRQSGVM